MMTLVNCRATVHRVPSHRSARPDPCGRDSNAQTLSAADAPAASTWPPARPGKGAWLHVPPCSRHAADAPDVCANAHALAALVTAMDWNCGMLAARTVLTTRQAATLAVRPDPAAAARPVWPAAAAPLAVASTA